MSNFDINALLKEKREPSASSVRSFDAGTPITPKSASSFGRFQGLSQIMAKNVGIMSSQNNINSSNVTPRMEDQSVEELLLELSKRSSVTPQKKPPASIASSTTNILSQEEKAQMIVNEILSAQHDAEVAKSKMQDMQSIIDIKAAQIQNLNQELAARMIELDNMKKIELNRQQQMDWERERYVSVCRELDVTRQKASDLQSQLSSQSQLLNEAKAQYMNEAARASEIARSFEMYREQMNEYKGMAIRAPSLESTLADTLKRLEQKDNKITMLENDLQLALQERNSLQKHIVESHSFDNLKSATEQRLDLVTDALAALEKQQATIGNGENDGDGTKLTDKRKLLLERVLQLEHSLKDTLGISTQIDDQVISQLQNQLQLAKRENEYLKQDLERARVLEAALKEELQKTIDASQATKNHLADSLQNVKLQLIAAVHGKEEAELERQKVIVEMERWRGVAAHVEPLKEQLQELKQAIQSRENANETTWLKEVEDAAGRAARAEERCNDLDNRLKHSEALLKETDMQRIGLTRLCEELQHQSSKLMLENEKARTMEGQIEGLNLEIEKLVLKCNTLNLKAEETKLFESEIIQLRSEAIEYRNLIKEVSDQNATVQQELLRERDNRRLAEMQYTSLAEKLEKLEHEEARSREEARKNRDALEATRRRLDAARSAAAHARQGRVSNVHFEDDTISTTTTTTTTSLPPPPSSIPPPPSSTTTTTPQKSTTPVTSRAVAASRSALLERCAQLEQQLDEVSSQFDDGVFKAVDKKTNK